MQGMLEWLATHQDKMAWLGIASIAVFFVSLLSLPWLVSLIPEDYFIHQRRRPAPWKDQHPAIRTFLLIGKNLLGVVLFCGGLIMLIVPGQGVLTIVMGILLLDYPGKYALERKIAMRPNILKSINWLRAKANNPPLKTDGFGPKTSLNESL